ncbi:MAG: SDR family NAD(P)-dependent oxidoreductase [Candidatus Methanoperedens sp.]|nr:SDR family NAD(P)-dependent oxidoreductase [Candidatus Methanoperedens sp.]
MTNKILITGGAGFIGSHLAEALVSNGYNVIVIDDLSRGKYENLNNIIDETEFIKGDITDFELMEDLIKKSDVIFHLAALSRVIPAIENPELCFKSNIAGTEIIARLCSRYCKKLFFSSSREVYGSAKYIPVDENHPLYPENPYGSSKVAGEKIIEAYSKCYDLNYVILRLANVYGKRDYDRVIPIFLRNSLENKDLIVYGGEQILDFIHIQDVVEAFLGMFENRVNNLVVNIGSGKGCTLIELSKIFNKFTEKKVKIIIKEKRMGEVESYVANIDKAQKIIGWRPKTSLEKGIMELFTIDWHE